MTSVLFSEFADARRRNFLLGAVEVGVIVAGLFAQDLISYLCVAIPALVPLVLWVRAGAPGIPVLPMISVLYFIYYAGPLLRGEIAPYAPDEVLRASAAVGGFLLAAALASLPFLSGMRRSVRTASQDLLSGPQTVRMVFVGLGLGVAYHVMLIAGDLSWLGASAGVLRAVILTLSSIACYLLGCARATRALTGPSWTLALAGMLLLILFSLNSLLLIGAAITAFAAVLGYVVTARRIPWISLGMAFAAMTILHAGKSEMRNVYWAPHSQSLQQSSLVQVPALMADWFTAGVSALATGRNEIGLFERASLLHMLLLAQRATPDFIPYMEGETYAMLPSLLVPRFVDPDKPESQAGLNLLSLRYGLQSVGSSANTTIGWGLVAEAYANFGYLGILPIGLLFGAMCGALMRLSIGAAPLSLPMFVTITATLTLFNVELDLSYLMVTLAQSIGAVVLIAALQSFLQRRRPLALTLLSPPPLAGEGKGGSNVAMLRPPSSAK
jgi:hypothetical protein